MIDYKKLTIWSDGISLVTEVYKLTKIFPKEEIYGLTNQMRRAAVSIPSNISEGSQRKSKKDFIYFLIMAKSSASELETQLIISKELGYVTDDVFQVISNKVDKIIRSISKYIQFLEKEKVIEKITE